MQTHRIPSQKQIEESLQSNKENQYQKISSNINQSGKIIPNQYHNSNQSYYKTALLQKNTVVQGKLSQAAIHTQKTMKISKLNDIFVQQTESHYDQIENVISKNQSLKIVFIKQKKNLLKQNSQNQLKEKESKQQIQDQTHSIIKKTNDYQNMVELQQQTPNSFIKIQLQQSNNKQSTLYSTEKQKGFYQSEKQKDRNSDILQIPLVFEDLQIIFKPVNKKQIFNHVFNWKRSCILTEPIVFCFNSKHNYSIVSEKVSRFLHSEFKIFLDKNDKKIEIGHLKSNFSGSIYNFYLKNLPIIYLSIVFKNQTFQNSGQMSQNSAKIRYCQIFLNNRIFSDPFQNNQSHQNQKIHNLQDLYLLNKQIKVQNSQILKFHSKIPHWSEEHNCFQMKFRGSAIEPSVKNAIFVDENQKQVMQFYKINNFSYEVSFQYPLSWIIVYCYALASTDFKICTQ